MNPVCSAGRQVLCKKNKGVKAMSITGPSTLGYSIALFMASLIFGNRASLADKL